jgi:hypothetical protein
MARRNAARQRVTTRASSRRGRGGERGAALVEAAVAIPFFVTIFVCLAFVGNLYVEKQRTVSLSRQAAWVHAMGNCEGQMPDVTTQEGGGLEGNGFESSESKKFEQAPGGNTTSKGFKMAQATIKGKVKTTSDKKAVFDQKVQTTTWVLCNEKPMDGDLKGMLGFAWGMLTGW